MHVVINKSKQGKKIYNSILLRESYREDGKVKKRTIANLSNCTPDEIAAITLALKHKDDLISIKTLHTFSYVPSPYTYHHQFLELYRECQNRGKGICYGGTIDEIKAAHKILKPNMTIYSTAVKSVDEFNELSEWFIKNT